jgi:hypothetical protein
LELHEEAAAPDGTRRVLAAVGLDLVATITAAPAAPADIDVPTNIEVPTNIDVLVPELVGRDEAQALVDAASNIAARTGAPPARLRVSDPLVRFVARTGGFDGPLRGVLAPADPDDMPPTRAEDTIAAQMARLLVGTDVRQRRTLSGAIALRVDPPAGQRIRVRLPRDGALMTEPAAAAVETLLAVKARFGRAASGVDAVSFDQGSEAITSGGIVGLSEGQSGVIALTPRFVSEDLLGAERRERVATRRRGQSALADALPFAYLDAVVAHECWHYLDAEIQVSGTAYVEFNAALGQALGVDSLEQALRGRDPGSPPAWQAAHARLVVDVSAYAGTSPREAGAEIFSAWWCNPASPAPVVARFGELVERIFPR